MSFQILINGISTGTVYALIAIGFALVFNILKFSNFSYGATMTASAFIAYFLVASKGWGLVPTLICSALAGALISLIGEFVGFRRILKNHSPSTYFFVSSITLGSLYEGLVTLKAGTNFYVYPNFFETPTIQLFQTVISKENIIMLIISVAALLALAFVIQKTSIGRAIRAVSFDRDTAQLMGINADRVISFTFCIGSSLAGAAGVLVGIYYNSIEPLMGIMPGMKAFVAAVLGGIGIIPGAMTGGIILGVVEAMVSGFISSTFRDAAAFAILIIILLIKPTGLFGKNEREKV